MKGLKGRKQMTFHKDMCTSRIELKERGARDVHLPLSEHLDCQSSYSLSSYAFTCSFHVYD